MDILEELKADHARFATTLEELEKLSTDLGHVSCTSQAGNRLARRASERLDKLAGQMRSHQDQERKLLFPAIRRRAPDSVPVLDAALREHSRLEQLLAQTQSFLPSTARRSVHRFAAALKAFGEDFRGHIRREEAEIFSLARTGFTRDELEGLAQEEEFLEFTEFVDVGGGN